MPTVTTSPLDQLATYFERVPLAAAVRQATIALIRRNNTILMDSVDAAEHVQAWLADPCEVNERLVRAVAEQLHYKGIWGSLCAAIVWREGANMIDPALGDAPAPKGLSAKMLAASILNASKHDPTLLSEFGAR